MSAVPETRHQFSTDIEEAQDPFFMDSGLIEDEIYPQPEAAVAPYFTITSSNEPFIIYQDHEHISASRTPRKIIRQRRSAGQRLRENDPIQNDPSGSVSQDGNGEKPPRKPPTTSATPEETPEEARRKRLRDFLFGRFTPFRRDVAEIDNRIDRILMTTPPNFDRDAEAHIVEDMHLDQSDSNNFLVQRDNLREIERNAFGKLCKALDERRLTRQDGATFNQYKKEIDGIEAFHDSISGSSIYISPSTDGQGRETIGTDDYIAETAALSIGALLRLKIGMSRFEKLLDDYGVGEEAREYLATRRILSTDFFDAKINGAPIGTTFTKTPKTQDDLRNALEVFIGAYQMTIDGGLVPFDEDHELALERIYSKVISTLPNEQAVDFSAWISMFIERNVTEVAFLTDANADTLQKMTRTHTRGKDAGITRPIVDSSVEVIRNIATIREQMYAIFTEPEKLAAASPDLLIAIKKYVQNEGLISDRLMHLLTFDQPDHLARAYRTIKRLIKTRLDLETAYSEMLDSMLRYATYIDVPTMEDADSIFLEDPHDSDMEIAEAEWLNMFGTTNKIRQTIRNTDFTFVTSETAINDITGPTIVEPSRIDVHFDKQKPYVFKMVLSYSNVNTEETLDLEITVDAKQRTIDWNVLEELPDTFKSVLFDLCQRAITETEKKARLLKQVHISASGSLGTDTLPVKTKRVHHRDTIYDFRKTQDPTGVQTRVAQKGASSEKLSEIEYEIVLSDLDKERYLRKLPAQVQEAILRKVDDYNNGRRGQFRAMFSRYTGTMLWRLRVGDYRILVREEGSTAGHMRFAVADIRQKKESYQHAAGL